MAAKRQAGVRQFVIGAGVMARDGLAGTVERVVVDPKDDSVVDLVVSVPRVGPDREVVLPVGRVCHADADGAVVDMSVEEVRELPELEEIRVRSPEAGWPGLPDYTPDVVLFWAPRGAVEAFVPPSILPEPNVEGVRNIPHGTVALSSDVDVVCRGETMGHLDGLLLDAHGDHATHLVVRRDLLGRDERLVPVSRVGAVTEERVELECDGEELDGMPRYRRNTVCGRRWDEGDDAE